MDLCYLKEKMIKVKKDCETNQFVVD